MDKLKQYIDYEIVLAYLEDKKIKKAIKKDDNYILFFNHFLKENKLKILRRSRIRKKLDS